MSVISEAVNVINQQLKIITTADAGSHRPLAVRAQDALGGQHKLRTTEALEELLSADRDAILDALDNSGIAVVLRRRKSDGAELIGLASRNS
ncbi:MAG: hypothetical protein LBV29_03145 [Azoarcus sp.]|jgi:hypothetical protein|nr:hypothetical protein [Azoarcus sp.]